MKAENHRTTGEQSILYLVMDTSTSVDDDKREIYNRVYSYYKKIYDEIFLVGFSTVGRVYRDIKDIKYETGGTYISSGLNIVVGELILNPKDNEKVILLTDGDNWSEDTEKTLKTLEYIASICEVEIIETIPSKYTTTITERIKDCINTKRLYTVGENEEIYLEQIKMTTFKHKSDSNYLLTIEEVLDENSKLKKINEELNLKLEKIKKLLQ